MRQNTRAIGSAHGLKLGGLCSLMPAVSGGNTSLKGMFSITVSIICRTSCCTMWRDDLHVEVKGKMTRADAAKINQFSEGKHPLLVVAGIPDGDTIDDIDEYLSDWGYGGFPHFGGGPYPFNFETIDGDYFVAHPGINLDGQFELFGDDSNYLCDRNPVATLEAYKIARQARFEYGQTPRVRKVSV